MSIEAFIVKLGGCMCRCRPVIDDTIPGVPDFANFYEMCLWSWGDKTLEETRRPIGFIHFCLLSADRGGRRLPPPSSPFLYHFITFLFTSSFHHLFPVVHSSFLLCLPPVTSPALLSFPFIPLSLLLNIFPPLFIAPLPPPLPFLLSERDDSWLLNVSVA